MKQFIELLQTNIVQMQNQNIGDNHLKQFCGKDTSGLKILSLRINIITSHGMTYLEKPNWSNLKQLNLGSNRIGDIGCKYLTRASMYVLSDIDLFSNRITDIGVFHISKATWKRLTRIGLGSNKIKSLQWMTKVKWPKLWAIYFLFCMMEYDGAVYVLLMESKLLQRCYLGEKMSYSASTNQDNRISDSDKDKLKDLINKKMEKLIVYL